MSSRIQLSQGEKSIPNHLTFLSENIKRLFVRVTYFFADGTYSVGFVSAVDGEFESMSSGDVIHVGIQVVDACKLRPGEIQPLRRNRI